MAKKPSEIKEDGKEVIGGIVSEIKSRATGYSITLIDENDDEVRVTVSPKLYNRDIELGKILLVSGVVKQNASGRKWMVAERIGMANDFKDEDFSKWKRVDESQEAKKEKVKEVRTKKLGIPKEKKEADPMGEAFAEWRDNIHKKSNQYE
jgi:hypothetical protein